MTLSSTCCPDEVVLRGRSTPSQSFMFEVYDLSDGELLLTEPPSRVASWLDDCGYCWVYGSSGVWKRKAETGISRPGPAGQGPGRYISGEFSSPLAGAA